MLYSICFQLIDYFSCANSNFNFDYLYSKIYLQKRYAVVSFFVWYIAYMMLCFMKYWVTKDVIRFGSEFKLLDLAWAVWPPHPLKKTVVWYHILWFILVIWGTFSCVPCAIILFMFYSNQLSLVLGLLRVTFLVYGGVKAKWLMLD